jgi:hypothetical protein
MVDVAVNFTLGNDEPVNAEFQVQPDVTFTADIKTETSTRRHEELINRDLPDQHPIDAITGLREAVDNVVNNIEGGSNIEVERQGDRAIINSATFIFEQGIASDVWVITHNLNKAPSITLVDSSGAEFQARKVYNSLNQVTIYLNGATTGKAYLN